MKWYSKPMITKLTEERIVDLNHKKYIILKSKDNGLLSYCLFDPENDQTLPIKGSKGYFLVGYASTEEIAQDKIENYGSLKPR